MNKQDPNLPTAGVIRRVMAIVYDSLLVFAVLFAATIPAVLLPENQHAAINNEDVVNDLTPLMEGWQFQLYLLVIYVGFFCIFWRKNGQTLGMQAWRLQLENNDHRRISIQQCLVRLLGAWVSALCLGFGFWWIWIDKEQLSWHDRWTQSRIVVLPKKTK